MFLLNPGFADLIIIYKRPTQSMYGLCTRSMSTGLYSQKLSFEAVSSKMLASEHNFSLIFSASLVSRCKHSILCFIDSILHSWLLTFEFFNKAMTSSSVFAAILRNRTTDIVQDNGPIVGDK